MGVRERLIKIRIIEKMKEPELREYGSRLGIKDVSYSRSFTNRNDTVGKKD